MSETLLYGSSAKDFKIPKVAITSDDGPHPSTVEDFLGALRDAKSPATLFWITENAKDFKRNDPIRFGRVLYEVQDAGHEIGYHGPRDFTPTFRTRALTGFGPRHLRRSLWELEGITGMEIKYFRPHTLLQPIAVATARIAGLRTPIPDPVNFAEGDASVEEQIRKFSGAHDGSIIVFHDGIGLTRSISNASKAVKPVIEILRTRGLEPTNISGLPQCSYRSL